MFFPSQGVWFLQIGDSMGGSSWKYYKRVLLVFSGFGCFCFFPFVLLFVLLVKSSYSSERLIEAEGAES